MSERFTVPPDRRAFLKAVAGTLASLAAPTARADEETLPPVRALTQGPKFHWFGYYDKLEFDPTGRHVLGMEVDFEHRTPKADDVIQVGMVDLKDKDRWIELGASRAWNWQQGCMLQWLPGSKTEVLWNDRDGDRFVCHILDVNTRKKRTLPNPVYGLSPDASWAVYPDFRRLAHARPGYGYAGVPDPNARIEAPEDVGIWKMDLRTGQSALLLSLKDASKIPYVKGDGSAAMHWFNHLLVSPDGSRFAFLHRWRGEKEGKGFATRLLTADADGKNLHVLDPFGKTSHFIWRDPERILAWAWHPSKGDKFYLYKDRTDTVEVVGADVMTENGHCTYLPGQPRWILNDTYPDKDRLQHPYLYDTRTNRRYPLGHFRSPPQYAGEWRCDTHPRCSRDGRQVVIDSPHGGNGRQLHLIDVSRLIG